MPAMGLNRLALKGRLITSYLVILAAGGLVTSLVGSWIVSSTIMREAQMGAVRNLATARTIYQDELDRLRRTVDLVASEAKTAGVVRGRLEEVWKESDFDFMGATDAGGRVVLRAAPGAGVGDVLAESEVVASALQGRAAGATEILGVEALAREAPALGELARIGVVPTPRAWNSGARASTSGMALVAAAPVLGDGGEILGTVYAGTLLTRNLAIVDRMWRVLYAGETYQGQPVGTVTIFQGGLRVATTVLNEDGTRALGTSVSDEVGRAVLEEGRRWHARAFVVSDWYLSAYEPIRDLRGGIAGILYVGVLERYYAQIRDRVIISFFAIAGLGFLMILAVTYGIMGNILRPIDEMATAARQIAAGDLDQVVRVTGEGEVAVLARSFNSMLESLRAMRADLEAWGRTLEEKVEQRSQELLDMQVRMARAERLASLGMLSAGVAHEINNPLGGVLALTALSLEEIPPDDPCRENLEEVVRQAERCKTIVKGLLDFSRQSVSSPEPVELGRAAREALALVRSQAAFFNVELVCDFDPDLPPVMADRSELQQVILNIVVNAVQAMDEHGRLTLTTRSVEGSAELSIADTGHGIPADNVDHVFDPFFTTKDEGHGTGLGLSIAYGIVSKHGGTISVESRVGVGSTFTVRFPHAPVFAREAYADQREAREPAREPALAVRAGS
ncbi:MAG: cache domain-containing protein [Longimicrobiales bacterium]|nr:cache domain-containing protein [Longimicrobiales bacterium]